eukprot:TRINITY_DN2771_c0_g2_i1.p2 TRINITY_DN2771_c0_g2~~TRINITY_DN2771_c0_g2_i1.p2  ORF type:complete len:160 (-),score=28.40 TRINITY_DN2771_c0_g2_i1:106-585(-)
MVFRTITAFVLGFYLSRKIYFRERKEKSRQSVKHVVMVRFKESVTEKKRTELIKAYMQLRAQISVIQDFEWGADVSVENLQEGVTHVFITTFGDIQGRDVYLRAPTHQAFASHLFQHLDKIIVVDYWQQGQAPKGLERLFHDAGDALGRIVHENLKTAP